MHCIAYRHPSQPPTRTHNHQRGEGEKIHDRWFDSNGGKASPSPCVSLSTVALHLKWVACHQHPKCWICVFFIYYFMMFNLIINWRTEGGFRSLSSIIPNHILKGNLYVKILSQEENSHTFQLSTVAKERMGGSCPAKWSMINFSSCCSYIQLPILLSPLNLNCGI